MKRPARWTTVGRAPVDEVQRKTAEGIALMHAERKRKAAAVADAEEWIKQVRARKSGAAK